MKRIKLLLLCCITAIGFSSCVGLTNIPAARLPQTHVVLKENNFRYVKPVQGEWSATYVLGIGGLSQKALENNSVADMYTKADLKNNQTIINATTTYSVSYIAGPVYMKKSAI